MNPAAILLGIMGSAVAVFAATWKGGGAAATASDGAPSASSDAFPMLPPPSAAATLPTHRVDVVNEAPASAIPVMNDQGRDAKTAAKELLSYVAPLIRNGQADVLGSKEAPNDIVKAAQRDMRKVVADGVYGAKTAARGKELLGIEFPARTGGKRIVSRQPPTAAPTRAAASAPETKPAAAAAAPSLAAAAPPAAPPPPDVHVSEHSPKEAANALLLYLTQPGAVDFGSKAKPNDIIKAAQRDMQKLVADGVYGPKTRERGKALTGKAFPARR